MIKQIYHYKTPRKSLTALISDCIDATDTVRGAAMLLLDRARADDEYWRTLMGTSEIDIAIDAVSRELQNTREVIWMRPTAPDARVAALAMANRTLMDFPLPGGKAIRMATHADLMDAAGFYKTQAGDMAWKGRWIARIAASTPKSKTAGEALTEAQLAKIKNDTSPAIGNPTPI